MRKILLTIGISLAGTVLFAEISEEQKTAFLQAKESVYKTIEGEGKAKLEASYEPMSATCNAIADWALESPKEYYAWCSESGDFGTIQWLVRVNLKNRYPDKAYTELEDICIWDAEGIRKSMQTPEVYEQWKAKDFSVDGARMRDGAIFLSALNAGDLAVAEAFDDSLLLGSFDAYFKAVEKAAAKMTARAAWEKYAEISKRFLPYKQEAKVKALWSRLEANQDAMATIASQETIINLK